MLDDKFGAFFGEIMRGTVNLDDLEVQRLVWQHISHPVVSQLASQREDRQAERPVVLLVLDVLAQ